jgi:hypothetical protein
MDSRSLHTSDYERYGDHRLSVRNSQQVNSNTRYDLHSHDSRKARHQNYDRRYDHIQHREPETYGTMPRSPPQYPDLRPPLSYRHATNPR